MYLSDFEYLHLLQRHLPPNFKVVRNRAKCCMLLASKPPPEILDQHYKAWSSADHHAKFHVDRLMHLGDLALNKKNCSKT